MNTLHNELRAAGASGKEARELAALAGKLKTLKAVEPEAKSQRRPWNRWMRGLAFGSTALAGLAVGVSLVIFSQSALPGDLLYPVQGASDAAAIKAYPQYRADVMMKRAAQVKQLVARHASEPTIMDALADYQIEAAAYKSTAGNYAAFEYCETSLRQAASMASPPVRSSIHRQLQALDAV